ncbi:YfcC family protein [Mangrovimonas cancribranchiae]|uniref:YfcC family protein n=1 Tax=Mangrovimonas cancribranchiae TaxID=3080055 RepID=A0AAU6PAL5_9FLAO
MKKIKFPTAQTILLIIAAFAALLTWLIPAGKYDTLQYNKNSQSFVIQQSNADAKNLPASSETLEKLNIKIPLEKFTNGDIWKPISVPGTYRELEATPQGLAAFLKSPIKGVIEAADIIFLVLIIGGLIGIMNTTGAFEAGISWLAKKLKGHEYWLIILVTSLIALGGTTFGLAEETIAFYPILIPIFLAAKYDGMVPLAAIYIGTSVGTMCSTVNPFSTIIASDAAGINWTTGLYGRIFMLVLCTTVCIIYILRYASKVKAHPEKSLVFEEKAMIESLFGTNTETTRALTPRLRLILLVFALCFIVMIIGVSQLDWWFIEMTTVFLVGAILIGVIGKIKEAHFVETFVNGASDLLGVALIIGIARGVSVIMEDGMISDTILHNITQVTSGLHKGVFANILLLAYSGLSFFIPSSSGMAVLTMPIMSPLADTFGFGREVIVNCYQYGMGIFSFLNPTGLILASLAMVKIGFNKWLKFVYPLVLILTVITMIWLTIMVL